ncbi:MAG: DUF1134 domain-containing protein [Proteobacteria bacterium]|nr:DUF1134 domain-containing protein [Pseudomonadota bacterium]
MDRRTLIVSGLITAVGAPALAQRSDDQPYEPRRYDDPHYNDPGQPAPGSEGHPQGSRAETYDRDEMVNKVSDFMGVTAEAAGGAIEHIFKDNGRPTGYIAGEEGAGAIAVGLRYGRGLLYMKQRPTQEVFWQGPTLGFDVGGNASRVFTLCYNLQYPDAIYRRFPGVEGSAYLIGGLGIQYQRAEDVTLAPIRAGVGLRLGANVGYLSYSRTRKILPF